MIKYGVSDFVATFKDNIDHYAEIYFPYLIILGFVGILPYLISLHVYIYRKYGVNIVPTQCWRNFYIDMKSHKESNILNIYMYWLAKVASLVILLVILLVVSVALYNAVLRKGISF